MTDTRTSLILAVRDPADAESWKEFYLVYEPLVLGYAKGKGLQEADAREVVSDVFLKLYKAMPSFDLDHARGRFRTWLWRVTVNAIADWSRRKPRGEVLPTDVAGDGDEPEAAWDRDYLQRILDVALQQVRTMVQPRRPQVWDCYERHVLKATPAADVAKELGITPNLVYVNASRVQKKVRDLCRARYEEELGHEDR